MADVDVAIWCVSSWQVVFHRVTSTVGSTLLVGETNPWRRKAAARLALSVFYLVEAMVRFKPF